MKSLNFSSLTTDQHVRQTQNIQNISQDHVKNYTQKSLPQGSLHCLKIAVTKRDKYDKT